MYSAYVPWCTLFPILNQSIVPCLVLIVASWPAYTFLRRQVRWSGTPISFKNFQKKKKNFPQFVLIHTVKGFSIVNEAVVDIFLEFSYFFYGPTNVDNLISGSSAFSKSSLYIWKFSVHILLKPSWKDFENYLAELWNTCSCAVVWAFFGIAFLWDWNENWPFSVLWPLLNFPNLLAYWVLHF